MTDDIHPDLAPLAVSIDLLDPLPGNPRRGDVGAVARSYETFGQRKPVVARRDGARGTVLAGNHQLAAARSLGWDRIAVVWVDDDDVAAAAFALADNHVGDLGGYDDRLLTEMLATVGDDGSLMAATSFTADDVAALSASADHLDALLASFEPVDGPGSRLDERRPITCPDCGAEFRLPR
jgi:ParB-like chromosome segregation protein Spo0J